MLLPVIKVFRGVCAVLVIHHHQKLLFCNNLSLLNGE